MLLSLHLQDFVIVDRAEIDFGPGFTALTGETGAGKSILLDALGLVLGARGDASVVREGRPRADLTASFASPSGLDEWLQARDLAGDPGTVLLRRVIESDGRSRALINGQPAPIALLREVGAMLVDVHGQHAAQSLTQSQAQRQLLDAFAGLEAELGGLATAHARWQGLQRALDQALAGERESRLECERLLWQLNELEALQMSAGSWDELNGEQRRLAHAATLAEGAQGAAQALADGEDTLADRLRALLSRLKPLAQIDPRLTEPVELLDSAAIQIDEAAAALGQYANRIEIDPQRLAAIERRVGAIFSASRKFRLSPESIPEEVLSLRERLSALERSQDLDSLGREAAEARVAFEQLAATVSERRRASAARLAQGVSATLGELGMSGARLEVRVDPAPASASGVDTIDFRIAQHGSSQARPIARVASGGELSRIGLAISVLAAQANPVPTLIFDEADAGVGGAVAEVIGALMRRLGGDRQVLCVTHLPQVAACAHQQLKVSRETQDAGIVSRVTRLERTARIEEIARMLGGIEITATTRKHAREMLAQSA
jgi:DNA repair protein RecN (Recombination protein N)